MTSLRHPATWLMALALAGAAAPAVAQEGTPEQRAQVQAQLQAAMAAVQEARTSLDSAQAKLAAARTNLDLADEARVKAEKQLAGTEAQAARGRVTRAQVDADRDAADIATLGVTASREEINAAEAELTDSQAKLMAAKTAVAGGCAMAIMEGSVLRPLKALAEGAHRTWFVAKADPHHARKLWINAMKDKGSVRLDAGAVAALRGGKSLLVVNNPGLYHVSIAEITLTSGALREQPFDSLMIAPGEQKEFTLKHFTPGQSPNLLFRSINDYGAQDRYSVQLSHSAAVQASAIKDAS